MRPLRLLALLLLAALAAAQPQQQEPSSSFRSLADAAAAAAQQPAQPTSPPPFRSPADAVASLPNLSLLVAAVDAAGLTAQFSSEDLPATIFAPTNAAMERAIKSLSSNGDGDTSTATTATPTPPEQLLRANRAVLFDVLRYHVVPGAPVWTLDRLRAADGDGGGAHAGRPPLRLMTLLPGASALEVLSDGTVLVACSSGIVARVVDGDVRAGASVLHVIDEVLIPAGTGGGGSDGLSPYVPPSPSPPPSPAGRVRDGGA
jgi:uncharacterized surface protein with fasciclin (FAS1) repeats